MKKTLIIRVNLKPPVHLLGKQLHYKNPNLSSEERAKDLISRLTLCEKATLKYDKADAVLKAIKTEKNKICCSFPAHSFTQMKLG